ncbi:T6SS immunity protein Tli4 family protein [Cupriavidus sp. BIC8F]|uniref:T6SS immunity protein Tli4 family protein n=1 Tax=Cupriavidus sp. BIC8F TaxID=3079014 RepID=UPI002917115C|nr:T6SS immunity protein Tli4 family protein [Cupriavidus sp. BIC8F]
MTRRGFAIILASLLLAGCQSFAYPENKMSEPVALSPRLQTLFAKTKPVCFGRYVMEVPAEAEMLWGFREFPGKIITHVGQAERLKERAESFRREILSKDRTAKISYFGQAATSRSWEIRYFEDQLSIDYGVEMKHTFVASGSNLFEWFTGGDKLAPLVHGIRARDNADIPTAPGVCIDHGFVADASGSYQEIFGAGIRLPSLPDVSFSVDSNKLASVDDERGLLTSIAEQRKYLGSRYPKLTTLREGKRAVGVWQGEESLVRRADGTHDFEWEAVGRERTTLHPAVIGAKMYTKVAANRIGAADQASLTDEEAVALWDRLLDGVRFRVNAPPTQTGDPVTVRSGETTPLSGIWRASLRPGHPQADWVASKSGILRQKGMPMIRFGLSPSDEALVVWTWMGEAST